MPFKKCIFNVYGDYFITNSFLLLLYFIWFLLNSYICMTCLNWLMHDVKLFKNFNLTIRAQPIFFRLDSTYSSLNLNIHSAYLHYSSRASSHTRSSVASHTRSRGVSSHNQVWALFGMELPISKLDFPIHNSSNCKFHLATQFFWGSSL
jgi:hypothetical protein